jgi:hypothetical protein
MARTLNEAGHGGRPVVVGAARGWNQAEAPLSALSPVAFDMARHLLNIGSGDRSVVDPVVPGAARPFVEARGGRAVGPARCGDGVEAAAGDQGGGVVALGAVPVETGDGGPVVGGAQPGHHAEAPLRDRTGRTVAFGAARSLAEVCHDRAVCGALNAARIFDEAAAGGSGFARDVTVGRRLPHHVEAGSRGRVRDGFGGPALLLRRRPLHQAEAAPGGRGAAGVEQRDAVGPLLLPRRVALRARGGARGPLGAGASVDDVEVPAIDRRPIGADALVVVELHCFAAVCGLSVHRDASSSLVRTGGTRHTGG